MGQGTLSQLNANTPIADGPKNARNLSPLAASFVPTDNCATRSKTKENKLLSFCYLNARSILARSSDGLPRFDHLYNFVCSDNSFDIILLTETHLDNSIDSVEINMDGYQIFRKDRNRHGGGVAVYVKDELAPIEIHVGIGDMQQPMTESLYVKILQCSVPCIIGAFYRPPNQSAVNRDLTLDALRNQFDYLCTRSNLPFFLFGDFNDCCVEWESLHLESELGRSLINLVDEYNLSQIINEPTRSSNLLDLLITNRDDCIDNVAVIDALDNLDHNMITGGLKANHCKQLAYTRRVRHFTDERLQTLNSRLTEIEWANLLTSDMTADECAEAFAYILTEEMDKFIPIETITVRPRDKPGMTAYVRKLFKKSHKLCRHAKTTKNRADNAKFLIARRKAKKEFFKAQQIHNEKLYAKATGPGCRSKVFWKILKQTSGNKKSQSIPTLIDATNIYTSDLSKATLLNAYFVDQSTLDLTNEPPLPDFSLEVETQTGCRIDSINVNPPAVFSILKSLDSSKATGPDGFGNNLLKQCASSLSVPISIIAKLSFDTGIFPQNWKIANVVPIFKKGDKQCKANYRPISLLSNISKVLERLAYSNLYDHCIKNKLLSPKNSGFKKGDGAINQMLCITDSIYKALDSGNDVAMVYLDISKAFDKVWHKGLLYKLQCFGVGGYLLRWIGNYLSNRHQRVVLNGQESSILFSNAGVPQGSILGPLLFLVFINDIEVSINANMFIFADDVTLAKAYDVVSEAESCLNSDLDTISKWAERWMVCFNLEKTVLINFSFKNKRVNKPKIEFNGCQIKQVQEHKHLGIIMSQDLKWSKHISLITTKANQRIGALYRQSQKMTRIQIETMYLSTIRPILEYGSVLFANCSVGDAKLIENVQRRAAVLSTGAIRRTETVKLMEETGWDSLELRRNRSKMLLFFQIAKKTAPFYLTNNISFKGQIHERSSRSTSRHNLLVTEPRCRLNCYIKSFFPDCIKNWNALTSPVVNSTSIDVFKAHLLALPAYASLASRSMATSQYIKVLKGHNGKLVTQFRLGLSPLRNDLFTYNIIENPFCQACGDHVETLSHYIFNCASYSGPRTSFINDMVAQINAINFRFNLNLDSADCKVLMHLITHGFHSPAADYEVLHTINSNLFSIVSTYLSATSRFTNSW